MTNRTSLREAIAQGDAVFASGYPPLGARLASRLTSATRAEYTLEYRHWVVRVRLEPMASDPGALFSCWLARRDRSAQILGWRPWRSRGRTIVDSAIVGTPDCETVADCMAEAYHWILQRRDVQRAIRRDPRWPVPV